MNKKADHSTADEVAVRELYHALLDYWNERSAKLMSSLYEDAGYQIGFDGTVAEGKSEIRKHLAEVFANHSTDPFVGLIKKVIFTTPNSAIVHAHAGMVPRGQKKKIDINPKVNAIQTMIATKHADGDWYVSLFQNTPAQFHGRPDEKEKFSNELRTLLKKA